MPQAENHLIFVEYRHAKVGQSHLQVGQSVTLCLLRVQREKLLGDRLEAELVEPARLSLRIFAPSLDQNEHIVDVHCGRMVR